MKKQAWMYGLSALTALGAAACSGVPSSESGPSPEAVRTETSAVTAQGPNLTWWNRNTGELSIWELSGSTVTGALSLDARCGPSDGCASTWFPFTTSESPFAPYIWWFDRFGTGDLSPWGVHNSTGHVIFPSTLSRTCDVPSCAYTWKPYGFGFLDTGYTMFWHNQQTNQEELWSLASDLTTVTSMQIMSTTCGAAEGCGPGLLTSPRFVADFDEDRRADIVWWNAYTGTVTIWLLWDSTGKLKSKQTLSMTLPASTGWNLVGAADADGDGCADLLWQHFPDGQMTNWLLDCKGNVKSTPTLSWTCDVNCNQAGWTALGYIGLSP